MKKIMFLGLWLLDSFSSIFLLIYSYKAPFVLKAKSKTLWTLGTQWGCEFNLHCNSATCRIRLWVWFLDLRLQRYWLCRGKGFPWTSSPCGPTVVAGQPGAPDLLAGFNLSTAPVLQESWLVSGFPLMHQLPHSGKLFITWSSWHRCKNFLLPFPDLELGI